MRAVSHRAGIMKPRSRNDSLNLRLHRKRREDTLIATANLFLENQRTIPRLDGYVGKEKVTKPPALQNRAKKPEAIKPASFEKRSAECH